MLPDNNFMLSVRLMTYNHGNFIRAAMDSIFSQQINFPVEVVVGDDFSGDKTLEIIRSYSDSDRVHIKILERKIGDEYWKKRQQMGRLYNFQNILENCSGKYIALLDGDDYWTDVHKLQKQVDFLESNPEFVICFHKISVVHDATTQIEVKQPSSPKEITGIEDLCKRNFIPPLSCVFRNGLIEIPSWFCKSPYGDWPLFLLLSEKGKIKYMNEFMGAYRVHQGGMWTHSRDERNLRNMVKTVKLCNKHFNNQYRNSFYRTLIPLHIKIKQGQLINGSAKDIKTNIIKYREWIRNLVKINAQKNIFPHDELAAALKHTWERLFFTICDFGFFPVLKYWKVSDIVSKKHVLYFLKLTMNRFIGR